MRWPASGLVSGGCFLPDQPEAISPRAVTLGVFDESHAFFPDDGREMAGVVRPRVGATIALYGDFGFREGIGELLRSPGDALDIALLDFRRLGLCHGLPGEFFRMLFIEQDDLLIGDEVVYGGQFARGPGAGADVWQS